MVTRKLTRSIRASIATAYNNEVINPQLEKEYLEKMDSYINNTPEELLKIREKYPSAIQINYIFSTDRRYIDYGNVPTRMKFYYPNGDSPTFLSLESLATFDDVREILPHLTKYLPA